MIVDFSNYELSDKEYGGSERKLGVIIDGFDYMLKFQKNTPFGYRYNHISEFLGSRIYYMLGFKVQETTLGTYKNEYVVACKDFVVDGYNFVPFNDVGESSIEVDKNKYQYSYEDIVSLLEANRKITNVEETIEEFFNVYVVDALLGNFDRHGANWGFLKKDNKYSMAPVFDNGSCLYPAMINEDEMKYVINNEDEIDKRIYSFPTSQIKLNNKKSSYYEVINSLKYDGINKALERIYPKIEIDKMINLIKSISIISDVHKDFYITMLVNRYNKIIKSSYEKLERQNERIHIKRNNMH